MDFRLCGVFSDFGVGVGRWGMIYFKKGKGEERRREEQIQQIFIHKHY